MYSKSANLCTAAALARCELCLVRSDERQDVIKAALHLRGHAGIVNLDVGHIDELQVNIAGRHVAQGAVEEDGVHHALQHLPKLVLF